MLDLSAFFPIYMCKLIDLKLKVIEEEIENVLDQESNPLYKITFSVPEWRQKLLAYVLSKVTGSYLLIGETQKLVIKHKFSYHSLELRLQLENHIHNGMLKVSKEIDLCKLD